MNVNQSGVGRLSSNSLTINSKLFWSMSMIIMGIPIPALSSSLSFRRTSLSPWPGIQLFHVTRSGFGFFADLTVRVVNLCGSMSFAWENQNCLRATTQARLKCRTHTSRTFGLRTKPTARFTICGRGSFTTT